MNIALGSFIIYKCLYHKKSLNKLLQADSTQHFMRKKDTPIKRMDEETKLQLDLSQTHIKDSQYLQPKLKTL